MNNKIKKKLRQFGLPVTLLVLLLVPPLFFPSVREAHVLCARLLLHLNSGTFVEGSSQGCIIRTIPNVQFTEKRSNLLRSRSTNSLEDLVLAIESDGSLALKFPRASASMAKHPLLAWAALRCSYATCQLYSKFSPASVPPTNAVAAAAIKNAFQFIRFAQADNPTNGAMWVAEAAVHFAAGHEPEALNALRIAATNRVWLANSTETREPYAEILQKSGLSELDSVIAANNDDPALFLLELESTCSRALEGLMAACVRPNDNVRFATLINLMVDLRRANCPDRTHWSYNVFLRFHAGTELANAMATKLGKEPIHDSTDIPWRRRVSLVNQIFEDYISLSVEPKVVGSFLAQMENYEREKRLRDEIRDLQYRSLMLAWVWASLSGVAALCSFTAMLGAIVFETAVWFFLKHPPQNADRQKTGIGWLVAILAVTIETSIFGNGLLSIGLGNEGGFGPVQPRPLISANKGALLFSLLAWTAMVTVVFFGWKKGKAANTHWLFTLLASFAYLLAIIAMAFFRHATVRALTLGYF